MFLEEGSFLGHCAYLVDVFYRLDASGEGVLVQQVYVRREGLVQLLGLDALQDCGQDGDFKVFLELGEVQVFLLEGLDQLVELFYRLLSHLQQVVHFADCLHVPKRDFHQAVHLFAVVEKLRILFCIFQGILYRVSVQLLFPLMQFNDVLPKHIVI